MMKEFADIALALIVGVVIVSAFSPNSKAGDVISSSSNGFANLLNAVSAPVRG